MATNLTSRHVNIAASSAPAQLPRIEPSAPFYLAHHPRRWTADHEAGRLLPQLVAVSTMPGVNQATESDPTAPEYFMSRRGFRVLPTDITGEMEDGPSSYLVEHQVQGGRAYLTPWEEPIPGTSATRRDEEGYRAFLAWLLDEGHVDAPQAHIVHAAVARLRQQQRQHARKAGTDPVEAEEAERLAREIEIWETALVPAPSQTAPTPTKRRRRKAVGEES